MIVVAQSSASTATPEQVDQTRIKYGFGLVVLSLLLVAGLFLFVPYDVEWNSPADVATGMGSVTTNIGTLGGFYFGHQAGSSGKERAEASREHSETMVRSALAHLDSETANQIIADAQRTPKGS